ncbi:MAG: hypothetical protein AB7E79_17085 [Rhodospirillaceae bacterium]
MTTDVLAFIEDPGAANYILPIITELESRGLSVALRIDGAATTYVQRPSIRRDETADALIARLRPRAVLVGTSENSGSLGLALIDAARHAGIPVAGAVDALGNAAGRFRGVSEQPLSHAPDLILVADRATAHAFIDLGQPEQSVVVCGHPQHDAVRERAKLLAAEGKAAVRRRIFAHADGSRPVLLFASEVSTGIGSQVFARDADYSLTGSGTFGLRTEIIIEEFLGAVRTLATKPYLVLRMHPKNTREELAPFLADFDDISAGGPGLDTVFAADAVVGMTSMLLVEAMLIGRPVLSILPREEERNLLSELQTGEIPVATSPGTVREGLRRLLSAAPASHKPETKERGAGARAADAIMRLIQRAPSQ